MRFLFRKTILSGLEEGPSGMGCCSPERCSS